MTDAIPAYGTQLQMGDGAGPEVFTTISEVKDITGPGWTADTIDVTSHSSPNRFEEVLASFKRSSELTFDCNYTPADPTHNIDTGVFSQLDDGQAHNYQLVWTDGYGIGFSALCIGFETQSPLADARLASVTLKPTGAPTMIEP